MQHAILAGIGVIAIRTAWGGLYLNFVKPGLRWWLLAAGAVVLAMGIYGALTDDESMTEGGQEDADEPDVHEAHPGPRIGWLLLVPFLVLSVIVPAPLGAFSAERDSGAMRSTPAADSSLPRLPSTSAPVTMTLGEYSVRAVWEKGKSLTANRVRLVGFVSSRRAGASGQSWYLTRMAMSCCAADAFAIKVDVRGGDRLPEDTWVAVTGTWVRSAGSLDAPGTLAALQVESMQTVTKPARPYEY
jgi:uncharacterized repeat protein (TIGR03943 family)